MSLLDLLESLGSFFVTGVLVGVMDNSQLAVSLLNLLFGGILFNPKNLVVG